MLFGALVALSMSTGLSLITYAQSAGPNINVLPIVLPTNSSPSAVLEAALTGDLYLNRQVEPAIAVSTRNPAHLLAFFNDYRAVNIPNDVGIGDEHPGTFTLAWRYVQKFFARLVGKPAPKTKGELPALAAAAEAWVGGSRSYDGGQTWSGMFLPGAPFDNSPASTSSPVYGLSAGTDPVLAAGPCGKFYLAFLAFDRGGSSKMAVATYRDLNDEQGGDTIVYEGTKVLESANNAQWGYFLDKPAIGVDPSRGNPTDPCGHNVYVTYTTFNGLSKDGKAQTKITLARSTNSGQTYSVGKLNQPYQQGQGTSIAIDPRDGTPQTTGGGTLYIAFRHFNDPDTILVHKSTNYGQTFSGQPANLLAGSTTPTLQKYDQPTIATGDTLDPPTDLMFRSLAFPSIAVTGDGTVMAAWTERVNIDPNSPTFGRPLAAGSPRIVVMRSKNGGNTWTDVNGTANARLAVDVGRRDEGAAAPPAGLGFLPQARDSGPQIQPYLSFGAGKLMMLYYESRGFMTRAPDAETILPADLTPSRNFATGIDRLFDVRAASLNPSTGVAVGSAQVSRYPLKTFADLSIATGGGETLDDVLAVNSPCSPDDGAGLVPCERRVDRANKPTARGGTSPSKGDYVGLTPAVAMVPRADGSGWRWAINPSDVSARAFHGIFADNRNLVPASQPANLFEWQRYQYYVPPFTAQCTNAGSKNSDVFVSRIDGDVVVTAPTTFTQLQNIQRTFPIVVSNSAALPNPRYFRLKFSAGEDIASFRQESNLDQEEILVSPFSSATRVAYVGQCRLENGVQVCTAPSTAQPVTVQVQEITGPGGNVITNGGSGTVTLNGDASNPLIINSGISNTELHNPDIGAPDIGAPDIGAPDIGAPDIGAPDIGAPDIGAPDIGASAPAEYYAVQDTTWTLTNTGNTTSAYTANVHIDNPAQYSQDYAFQLIIHKSGGFGALYDCASGNHTQSRIISIIANPDIGAPDIGAPDIGAPDIGAPDIGAATFAMGPSDAPTSSSVSSLAARSQVSAAAAPTTRDDGTLKAPKAPETIQVTLRAYQKKPIPGVVFDPTLRLPAIAIAQQSKNNLNGELQPLGVAADGADLRVSSGAPTVTPSPVQAGNSVSLSAWTLQNAGNITATPSPDQGAPGMINNSVYLSSDNTFGAGDTRIGSAGDTGALAAGATAAFGAFSVTIPLATVPGTYYLFIVADDGSQSVTGEVNELNENNNASAGAAVTVAVVNVAPIASDQPVATNEDTAKAITLAASDANDDSLTFSIVANPSHGTLSGTAPSVTYTPAANYNGADSFTFKANDASLPSNVATVSITVNAVNDAPVASGQGVSTDEDTPLGIVLAATDIDSASLTYNVGNPSHGTLSGTAPNLNYTPALNYSGPDGFTFTVNDGAAGSNVATVSITVAPVNDAPIATNQNVSTNEDVALQVTLGASDLDSASLTLSIVTGPTHGSLSGTAPVIYTPAANYNGPDSFTFKANDGSLDSNVATVSITVNPVNDAPVASGQPVSTNEDTSVAIALAATDVEGSTLTYISSNPSHGTLTGTGANLTYTPAANYNGPDSFTFKANDGSLDSNVATVSITVNPVNDAPVASGQPVSTNEDTSVAIALAATDVEGSTLTYIPSNPSHGTLTGTGANLTYTPAANYNGPDSFTFKANDGSLDSNVATVSITVIAVNDAPVANNQNKSVVENIATAITLTAADVDSAVLTYSLVAQPTHGTLSGTAPNVTYTPQMNYEGPDSFTFRANDGSLNSNTATVSITVTPGINQYGFNGLLSPYQAPPKFGNLGSSQPMAWQYTLGGVVVNTSAEMPKVTFTKMNATNTTCTSPAGDQTPVPNSTYFVNSASPGNSTFQYNTTTNTWQFNWQTGPPVTAGCWNVRVILDRTGQVNGPFPLRLR